MIYEVRTYDLKPGAIPQAEEAFAEALPIAENTHRYPRFGIPKSGHLIKLFMYGVMKI
ncbi:MAG: hypothetical protein Ct9H300mP27_06900 [Chloroflexota bacterium]|nr:MAG: hypothetical protein Ct9H300mP27_06900 [Chloroflexota bacterium]